MLASLGQIVAQDQVHTIIMHVHTSSNKKYYSKMLVIVMEKKKDETRPGISSSPIPVFPVMLYL